MSFEQIVESVAEFEDCSIEEAAQMLFAAECDED